MSVTKPDNTVRELSELRREMDEIDNQISLLLIQRLKISESIGKIKKGLALNSYTPERERETLARVTEIADSPQLKVHLRSIFQRIIDQSRAVQRKFK